MSDEVVIVAAARTPIGAFNGKLSSLPATELGAQTIKAVLAKTGIQPEQVDEVILGHVITAGCGQNPARQTAIHAGLPVNVPAMTINKVCGSGLKSVQLAVQAIRCGDAELIIAGGQESMSQAPHLLPHSRSGQRMGDWSAKDSMILDGLWDAFNDYHMGCTAENVADKYGISREVQDAFAAESQQRAEQAQKSGRFKEEIVPVTVPQRKGDPVVVDTDEFPRHGTTVEGLGKLRPAFQKEGSVTAGNSSGINDGAAIVVVCSRTKADALGLPVLATVKAYSNAAIEPAIMGVAPIYAARRCLERAGWDSEDLDLIELNEAFAAQSVAVVKEMNWDTDKVNVNGGAIALGHPIGGSGARILVTLLHEMPRRNAKRGLATLCIGGGQSVAVAVER